MYVYIYNIWELVERTWWHVHRHHSYTSIGFQWTASFDIPWCGEQEKKPGGFAGQVGRILNLFEDRYQLFGCERQGMRILTNIHLYVKTHRRRGLLKEDLPRFKSFGGGPETPLENGRRSHAKFDEHKSSRNRSTSLAQVFPRGGKTSGLVAPLGGFKGLDIPHFLFYSRWIHYPTDDTDIIIISGIYYCLAS